MKPLPLADLEHILARAPWEELQGARIFITGGTGFFGIWLLESLVFANGRLDLGICATILSRAPEKFAEKAPHLAQNPALSWVAGDVRSFKFPDGQFSHVIHAATEASASLNLNAPLEMFDVCYSGTRHALELARHCGAKKFLLTSSGAVYGKQPPELSHVPEEFEGAPNPLDAAAAYAKGKQAAEWLSAVYGQNFGFTSTIARAWAFVGPHLPLDTHFAMGNFLRDALKGGPIRIGGDGTPLRSYLHAADLTIWLWTILVKGVANRPYNVGSDEAVSIAQTAQAVARAFSPPPRIKIAGKPVPGAAPSRYVPGIARVRQELGLEVWIGLDEAIERTVAWLRD